MGDLSWGDLTQTLVFEGNILPSIVKSRCQVSSTCTVEDATENERADSPPQGEMAQLESDQKRGPDEGS